ncbi:MAG TPA: FtsX-like permease family protein [Ilumatobacteraceae bacterium]|nr:FtsX-like permease family protein [Ilumatobacteraceae bacterium]
MFNATLKGLWARKRRLIGTSLAVVLGVAFLAATLVLGDTMRNGFDQAFADANAGLDVVVRSSDEIGTGDSATRGAIDAATVDQVAAMPGVRAAVPTVDGVATLLGADGERIGGDGPPTEGTNWIDDPALNPYDLAEGRAPQALGEVVIDRGSAKRGDLHVGDTTTVLTPTPVEVTIVGIATFGDVDSLGPTTYTAFTLPQATELFAARPDTISSVLVAAEDGVSQETLRQEITEQLPARIEALTQDELTAEQNDEIGADFLDMFSMILLAFAGIALVVATFSIHNTFSILVAQRTRESALLRAIGASRRQVITAVGVEALVVGVIASAIGFAVGIGLATGLDALMGGAGLDLPSDGLVISTGTIVAAGVVGILTTLVASIAPAIKASRVAPLAAMRDVAVDRSGASKLRAIAGVVIAAAGAVAVVTATSSPDGAMARAGLGALAMLVGFVVLGPVVARPSAAVLGAGASATRGFTGRLARRNAMRNPRRIAGSAAALMVGTAVVALFTTFGSSVKASIGDMVDDNFGGDLIVAQTDFSGAGIDPAVAPAIGELPEVAGSVGSSLATARIGDVTIEPMATDPAALAAVLDLDDRQGHLADVGPGEIAVSTRWADDHDVALGDVLPLTFVDGTTTDLTVANLFERQDVMGNMIMTSADWAPHAGQAMDVVLFVTFADGVSEEAGKAAVTTVTEQFGAPDPQTRAEYKASMGEQIDQMLYVIYGLLGIAVLIAVMGIGNTLALSIHERTRELGLLRAVGQSRAQLRSSLRWESVIVAVFGTVGGLGLGTFLGWGLMRALHTQEGFGVFALPVVPLAVILVLAAVAGVVAALRPARRAARMDILDAIATS